jgi:hypothetical protein
MGCNDSAGGDDQASLFVFIVSPLTSGRGMPECFDKDCCIAEGWMNQTQAAAFLDISAGALRQAVSLGEIDAEHPLPDGPSVYNRLRWTHPRPASSSSALNSADITRSNMVRDTVSSISQPHSEVGQHKASLQSIRPAST